MSILNDYAGADCKRLRVPAISITLHTEKIESIILKSWENGGTASQAMKAVLNDADLTSSLVSEISKDLDYQRNLYTDGVNEKLSAAVDSHRKGLDDETGMIRSVHGKVVSDMQHYAEAKADVYARKREDCDYSAMRLRELRMRVQKRMRRIGGEDRLKELLKINELVINTPTSVKQAPGRYTRRKPSGLPDYGNLNPDGYGNEKKVNPAMPEQASYQADTLPQGQKEQGIVESTLEMRIDADLAELKKRAGSRPPYFDQPKKPLYKRIREKIWKVLTYKIF
jgi:hypothetical protein